MATEQGSHTATEVGWKYQVSRRISPTHNASFFKLSQTEAQLCNEVPQKKRKWKEKLSREEEERPFI